MSATIKKRDILIVAAIAILIEGILIRVASHQHASHNLSLLLIFHLPGIVLAELMHIPDPESLIVLGITGAVQLFIVFFVGWVILKQIYGRRDT
jgi:hypothetical protein